MLDTMRKTVECNLLKYSAGHHIFCPICDTVADFRNWVIVDNGKQSKACCASCFDAAQGDNPLPEGWTIVRSPKKAKRAIKRGFPTSHKALAAACQRDALAYRKRIGDCTKTDRLFPQGYGQADWPMVTTTFEDTGEVRIDYAGDPVYSAYQINEYVRQYCELNHLKA